MRTVLAVLLTFGLLPAALAGVDVNTATPAELDSVRGIGPGLSARILAERERGAFQNWDDFARRVKGIKPRRVAQLAEAGLTVGHASSVSHP